MHESKFEIKYDEETKGLKGLCEKLEKCASTWFEDIKDVDTKEAGEVIDMIKDIYEAKEKIAKTCYYKSIVKAMEKAEEDEEKYREFEKHMMESDSDEWDRMGYRGRAANGRFVHRAGRGRNAGSGYTPHMFMMDDRMEDDDYIYPEMMNYRMGYSAGRGGNRMDGRSGNYGGQNDGQSYGYSNGGQSDGRMDEKSEGSRYGKSYDRYDMARKHYHDTKNADSMKKMEESFGDILDDFGEIADDTWKDLSPEQKAKQKPKINQMIQKLQRLQQM